MLYMVGQFDARVIDVPHCTITLAEFRTLDRYVTFLGSFDENEQKRWTYFPPVNAQNSPLRNGEGWGRQCRTGSYLRASVFEGKFRDGGFVQLTFAECDQSLVLIIGRLS